MKNQSEQVAEILERLIEDGIFKPGSLVSESYIMKMTGFGRTPIREAIQKLALNRIVQIHPNKGIEIRAISVEDQLSGLEVRRALEVLAVGLACDRAKENQLQAIIALANKLDGNFELEQYAETIRETHSLIIQATNNPYLEALMTPLQTLSRRFWLMNVRGNSYDINKGKKLHQDILVSISKKDKEKASLASIELNNYLVDFALSVIQRRCL